MSDLDVIQFAGWSIAKGGFADGVPRIQCLPGHAVRVRVTRGYFDRMPASSRCARGQYCADSERWVFRGWR